MIMFKSTYLLSICTIFETILVMTIHKPNYHDLGNRSDRIIRWRQTEKEKKLYFQNCLQAKKTHSRPEIWKNNPLCKMCFPTSMTQATYVISISSHNQHYSRVLVNSDITTDTYDVFNFILVEYIWLTYPPKNQIQSIGRRRKINDLYIWTFF